MSDSSLVLRSVMPDVSWQEFLIVAAAFLWARRGCLSQKPQHDEERRDSEQQDSDAQHGGSL